MEKKKSGKTPEKRERTVKEQITLRLPKELLEQFRKEAAKKGISLNAYIVFMLLSKAKKDEKNKD